VIPIYLDGKLVGRVEGNEYITSRTKKTVFHNVPCRVHTRCDGFAISKEVLDRLKELGVVFVRVELKGEGSYVTSLKKLLNEGADIRDRESRPQLALPLHEWLRL